MSDDTITMFDITEPITDVDFVRIMDPKLAQTLFGKIKDKSIQSISSIESFPNVAQVITALWRHTECLNYLEKLILVENGEHREGFPVAAHEEIFFLYHLLTDQYATLKMPGEQLKINHLPGTFFTSGQ